jgi:transposase
MKRKQGVPMEGHKIREIVRLKALGYSQTMIAQSVGVARSTVQDYVRVAQAAGLSAEESCGLGEQELRARLGKDGGHRQKIAVELDYGALRDELRKKGVTLELLFRELLAQGKMPVSYATFCRRVQEQRERSGVAMHQEYAAGEYLLVDYTGPTVSIWNQSLETVLFEAAIFVGVLGASGKIFCEATASQAMQHFLGSHVRAFRFFGGLPKVIVPDNLKSAVKKVNWYEPNLTRAYQELAEYYGLAILPTRARAPRDKGKVERAVLEVERWILAVLRNRKFTSLAELNDAIRALLAEVNAGVMREYGASRDELFERIERSALRVLPPTQFEPAECKLARVNIDYHVDFERHRYSVPFQYVHQEVWVRATEFTLSVHRDGKSIATHARCRSEKRFTTLAEHMPPAHQAMHARSTVNFLQWAKSVGSGTHNFVEKLLCAVRHEQQAYRTIMGLQRLAKTYSAAALERAAAEAAGACALSYGAVHGIIARHHAEQLKDAPVLVAEHANLRDPKLFH